VDIDCTENVHNKSLVCTGTQTSSKLLISRSKSQGQETYCFEGAHIEFPSHWDFNSVSQTAKELSNTFQTNAKYHMPNTICQIADTKTNAKQEMPKNCQIVYSLLDCQLKYADRAARRHNAKEKTVMKGDSEICNFI